jgi:NitT/TauT family transport system substrate-binding protein
MQIEIKNYPWADLIPEAIQEGEIDGAVGTPPLAVLAAKGYGYEIIVPPAFLWSFNPSYGIVVNQEMLREEAILEEFLTLHERACNLIRQKPVEAAEIVADEIKVVNRAFVLEVFSVSPRYCAKIPKDYIDATMAFIPALQEMGYLEHQLTKVDIFELSFIEKIHPGPHHYS